MKTILILFLGLTVLTGCFQATPSVRTESYAKLKAENDQLNQALNKARGELFIHRLFSGGMVLLVLVLVLTMCWSRGTKVKDPSPGPNGTPAEDPAPPKELPSSQPRALRLKGRAFLLDGTSLSRMRGTFDLSPVLALATHLGYEGASFCIIFDRRDGAEGNGCYQRLISGFGTYCKEVAGGLPRAHEFLQACERRGAGVISMDPSLPRRIPLKYENCRNPNRHHRASLNGQWLSVESLGLRAVAVHDLKREAAWIKNWKSKPLAATADAFRTPKPVVTSGTLSTVPAAA